MNFESLKLDSSQRDLKAVADKKKPKNLPTKMRAYLERQNVLYFISLVLDEYETRARIIVGDEQATLI